MLYRIIFLFFFIFSVSYSQRFLDLDIDDFTKNYAIELNNIGDPILLLTTLNSGNDLYIQHYSQNVREIDYVDNMNQIPMDSIYSQIVFNNAYNEGGFISALFSRPLSPNLNIKFLYNNLSSQGFYFNQKNKYSHLLLLLKYLNKNKPYSILFKLQSTNGDYLQNGGVENYNSLLDMDLMPTNLTNAQTFIKKRNININQKYLVKSNLAIRHTMDFNYFQRDYIDSNVQSFYYSMTPLLYLIKGSYENHTFLTRLSNSISMLNNYVEFSINHHYYDYRESYHKYKSGDLDISLSSNNLLKSNKIVDFNLNFCPTGYNKNNYVIDINFDKTNKLSKYNVELSYVSKKPNLFTDHYDTGYTLSWEEFQSIKVFSIFLKSKFLKHNFLISSQFKRYMNFVYFDNLASPEQHLESLLYFNLRFHKVWDFNSIVLTSDFCVQKSNNIILSVPDLLFVQKIQYHTSLSSNLNLKSSINFSIFSKYYIQSFFPLTDVFYLQEDNKKGFYPIVSTDIFIDKQNFSIGLVIDNLTTLFTNNYSFIDNYFLSPTNVRLSIRWQFLD